MEHHLHDQHGQIGELENQAGSPTFYKGDGNSTGSLKQMLSGFKPIENKCPQQQETSQERNDLQMSDNLSLSDFKVHRRSAELVEMRTKPSHLCSSDVNETLTNVEHDDEDKDVVVVGQLRNGCDNSSFDQKQDFLILPEQMENIYLNQTSSDETIKENLPETSRTKNRDSISSLSTSKYKTICVSTPNSSISVIPLAGQNTTKVRDFDKSKSAKDYKEQCLYQRVDENAASLSVGGGGLMRGNNLAQCITNISKDTINASINNQTALKHACSPCVLPLHACNTLNHFHHSHNHLHIHHHNHNHNNQSESENYANELTNALSSRLLFHITNNSSYCTNSASNSQVKRQSSFLKSQSLEIVLDSPSIIYHETGDDDEEIFFSQLSGIDDDDIKQINSQYFEQHPQSGPQQSNVGEDPSTRKAKTLDTEEDIVGAEDVANTRSMSFSSHKTGPAFKTQSLESRPIYPNVPYSPYASPYSSPRSNRRRPPLRESRRISIEQSGSFLQLNQYKLMDQIGQVSSYLNYNL